MKKAIVLLACFTFAFSSVFAQDNTELSELYELDQAARQAKNIDWESLAKEDLERRQKVLEMLSIGEIKSANDYFNAAMIFQHGDSKEDIRIAHSFATLASVLDENLKLSHWLKAATWDRLLLRFDEPQWYGTQYIRNESGGIELYLVAPDIISDEERTNWGVPTLEEARARATPRSGQ